MFQLSHNDTVYWNYTAISCTLKYRGSEKSVETEDFWRLSSLPVYIKPEKSNNEL